ncbi:hypothetical protein ACWENA_08200 [Streptomyces sp. NPDC004779]
MAAPRRSAKAADPEAQEVEHDQTSKTPDTEETDAPAPTASGLTELEHAYMAALQRERAGYERRGMSDRVAQVDAELKRLGTPPSAD